MSQLSGENAIEMKEVEGLSQGKIVFRRFTRHKAAMVSIFVLLSIILLAFTSVGIDVGSKENKIRIPGWWDRSYTGTNDVLNSGVPTLDLLPEFIDGTGVQIGAHPFGQDEIGRDGFARVMRGAQQSLMVMFVVGLVATTVGVVIGALAGFYRRWIDQVLMRFTDLIITIPIVVIGAVIGRAVGNLGTFVLALFLGLFAWTGLARLVRGEFLSLREREFVDAARMAGATNSRIIFKHIFPNAIGVVIVNTTLLMSAAILLETGLSFIGFGVQAPDVSLGYLISENQNAFSTRPWLFWYPGVFIVAIALCVNFIGDGLRDAFDPRQKRKMTKQEIKAARNGFGAKK
jgi:ABC-type dipeptide/oligopeptide/nickel transport system permease subunit